MKRLTKTLLIAAAAMLALAATPVRADETVQIGYVDFRRCLEESKMGKSEQSSLEALHKQLTGTVEGTERELNDLATKLRDPDHMDSLSPEAEQQLKVRAQTLAQEHMQQKQQYEQILQQAQYKVINDITVEVENAASKVAKDKEMRIHRSEVAFYFPPNADVTDAVIAIMDENYAKAQEAS